MDTVELGGWRIPEWMVTDPHYASALFILEDLAPDDRLDAHVHRETEVVSIDFYALLDDPSWSSTQHLLLALAAELFGAAMPPPGGSLGQAVETLDDRQLTRVLLAIDIRRGRLLLTEALHGPTVFTRCRELGRQLLELWDEIVPNDTGFDIDLLHFGTRLAKVDEADVAPTSATR